MDVSTYYASNPKVQKYIKEGRGQGFGKDYLPWTTTHDFSSIGRVTRIMGVKVPRIYYLQSDNQYRAFLMFEFSSRILDVRENIPLLDIMEVIDYKEDLRFDKFRDKETGEPFVLTTNFLLTVQEPDGTEKYLARAVKNTSDLKRKITLEKLEVERRYWLKRNIDWKIITEKQLPRQLAKNIEWVRETLLVGSEADLDKEQLSISLLRHLLENNEFPLKEVLRAFDKREGLKNGLGLFLFRYLIARKEIRIDMRKMIDLSSSVKSLIL